MFDFEIAASLFRIQGGCYRNDRRTTNAAGTDDAKNDDCTVAASKADGATGAAGADRGDLPDRIDHPNRPDRSDCSTSVDGADGLDDAGKADRIMGAD